MSLFSSFKELLAMPRATIEERREARRIKRDQAAAAKLQEAEAKYRAELQKHQGGESVKAAAKLAEQQAFKAAQPDILQSWCQHCGMDGLDLAEATAADVVAVMDYRLQLRAGEQAMALGFPVSVNRVPVTKARPGGLPSANTVEAKLAAVAAYFGLRPEQMAAMTYEERESAIAQRAWSPLINAVASCGVPASDLPSKTMDGESASDSIEELQQQMREEMDPVRLGKLAARANALRDKQWNSQSKTPTHD